MFATRVSVEVLVIAAIKAAETFDFILYGMRVYDVHNDCNAKFMGAVNEAFQFLGSSEAA